MTGIFSKILLPFSLILSFIGGPSYIQLNTPQVILNFKTGDTAPIFYYLNVKNIGSQKARFEISSDSPDWIFNYREGLPAKTSAEIYQGAAINFVLEIHPEKLSDGKHNAQVVIKAVATDPNSSNVYETQSVNLTLNKNFKETPTPVLTPEQSLPVSLSNPSSASAQMEIITPSPIPAIITNPVKILIPKLNRHRESPPLNNSKTPLLAIPSVSPSSSPSISKLPLSSEKNNSQIVPRRSFIKSIWSLFRKIFSF